MFNTYIIVWETIWEKRQFAMGKPDSRYGKYRVRYGKVYGKPYGKVWEN